MERCFVELVFESNCQTACPESLVTAVPTEDNLTPMTVATNVVKLAIMPMIAIALARGVDVAVGLDLALGLDLVVGATALAAVVTRGSIVHLHTQNAEAGQVLLLAPDPELLCDARAHLCAGPKALSEDPEHLSVEIVAPGHVPLPDRGNVVCLDLARGQSATKKTVIPGLPAQGEVQHQTLTDLICFHPHFPPLPQG